MYYLIKRTDQGGGYLAKPGSKKSYTNRATSARVFYSLEDAQDACCPGNEIPVPAPCPPNY